MSILSPEQRNDLYDQMIQIGLVTPNGNKLTSKFLHSFFRNFDSIPISCKTFEEHIIISCGMTISDENPELPKHELAQLSYFCGKILINLYAELTQNHSRRLNQ